MSQSESWQQLLARYRAERLRGVPEAAQVAEMQNRGFTAEQISWVLQNITPAENMHQLLKRYRQEMQQGRPLDRVVFEMQRRGNSPEEIEWMIGQLRTVKHGSSVDIWLGGVVLLIGAGITAGTDGAVIAYGAIIAGAGIMFRGLMRRA